MESQVSTGDLGDLTLLLRLLELNMSLSFFRVLFFLIASIVVDSLP